MHKYLILLTLLQSSIVYAFCKLNIYGDRICLKDKAIRLFDRQEGGLSYEYIRIRDINFPVVEVRDEKRNNKIIHIDEIAGPRKCREHHEFCSGEQVIINHECLIDENEDQAHRIENVYSRSFIEIRLGNILSRKNLVLPIDCIIEKIE